MADILEQNARDLERELAWFRRVLDLRLQLYFAQEAEQTDIFDLPPPDLSTSSSNWARLLREQQFGIEERLALLLALVPHLEPGLLDILFTKNTLLDRMFTDFGGRSEARPAGFVPTGETLLFLLSGSDLTRRFRAMRLFRPDHPFATQGLLALAPVPNEESRLRGAWRVSRSGLAYLTHGAEEKPVFGKDFPAEVIETSLEWTDLVLDARTLRQIQEIETWIEHGDTLLHDWKMRGRIRPGFRALFHGKPGTGKTMTACLLGKTTGRPVYRVDLSMIVSKYIGETEKNLAQVFRRAEDQHWILFFDEADALFGKRTETKSSHDRYANQEVAYLLQRVENYPGVVILASNFAKNIDEAFSRRFEAIVSFSLPSASERLRIWRQSISSSATLAPAVDLQEVAKKYELSGGAIMNVIRYASLEALRRQSNVLTADGLGQGIKRELMKEGKLL